MLTSKETYEIRKTFHIEKEIRKDKKEKRDYIIEEIESTEQIKRKHLTEYDRIRYEMLLKLI